MRDIKFRAWDKVEKRLIPDYEFDGLLSYAESAELSMWLNNPNIELMQYTGLKDSKGKEIYESDIVKVKNEWNEESAHVVYWGSEYDYPAFDLRPTLIDELNSLSEVICGQYEYEVIGNIHESPNLIADAGEL